MNERGIYTVGKEPGKGILVVAESPEEAKQIIVSVLSSLLLNETNSLIINEIWD